MLPEFDRLVTRDHRTYRPTLIEPVLEFLSRPILPDGSIAHISRATSSPQSTFSAWRKYCLNPACSNWCPNSHGRPGRRVFPTEIESALAGHFKANYREPGQAATRSTVATLTKGKTNQSHAKFGAAPRLTIRHTPNGWTNDDVTVTYVE
jgi:hypothetical protein